MGEWPGPDATYSEIVAFYRTNSPDPPPPEGPEHEAPLVTNGPSIVCSACEVVRIGILGPPFCRACLAQMG